jgi:DNA-binding FadR family transcriptional regulator
MEYTRKSSDQLSVFLNYLALECQDGDRIPPLARLSSQLGVSIASLREQLEVARSMGIVEVHPKTGIRRVPYTFNKSVSSSLAYAVEVSPANFPAYSDLRRHIEAAYWHEAVIRLTPDDHFQLRALVQRAFEKLALTPPQIPQYEHRELHLIMYRRLGNNFVAGLLEAFWETYEAVGLDTLVEMDYLQRVWHYHHNIVEAICSGDYEAGFHTLREHMDLLNQRPKSPNNQKFE